MASKSNAFVCMENLKDLLECTVCLKMQKKGPIYQCEKGHCVCSDCRSKLTRCPVCRIPLGNTRSLIYEKMLEQLPHSCKFEEHGCQTQDTSQTLEAHERDCQHRLVNCFWLRCKTQVPMSQLLKHENNHDLQKLTELKLSKNIQSYFGVTTAALECKGNWYWEPTRIIVNFKHYFLEAWRNPVGQWFIWMYTIGSREECEKLIYQVKVVSGNGIEELFYRGHCISLDVTKEQIAEACNCLTFSDAIAKRLRSNNRIKYIVDIEPAL